MQNDDYVSFQWEKNQCKMTGLSKIHTSKLLMLEDKRGRGSVDTDQ